MHSHGIEINLVISIVERRSIYWGSMFGSKTGAFRTKYRSKSKGHILCVQYCFFLLHGFNTIVNYWHQNCLHLLSTWLGLVHTGRRHPLTQPLPLSFLSVTKPLQSWPLWPSWQLWAQICRSSWRLKIGSNVCKHCSLNFDFILFFFFAVLELLHPLSSFQKSSSIAQTVNTKTLQDTRVLDKMAKIIV